MMPPEQPVFNNAHTGTAGIGAPGVTGGPKSQRWRRCSLKSDTARRAGQPAGGQIQMTLSTPAQWPRCRTTRATRLPTCRRWPSSPANPAAPGEPPAPRGRRSMVRSFRSSPVPAAVPNGYAQRPGPPSTRTVPCPSLSPRSAVSRFEDYQRARRGRGWQVGHVYDDRFMNASRRIGVPQRGQGRPS